MISYPNYYPSDFTNHQMNCHMNDRYCKCHPNRITFLYQEISHTLKELVFAETKFCKFCEFWWISRKFVPVNIIRKLSIREIPES